MHPLAASYITYDTTHYCLCLTMLFSEEICLPTHPPTHSPTYLPTLTPTYTSTHPHTHPHICSPFHLPTYLPWTHLPTHPCTWPLTYQPTHPPTYHTPTYLSIHPPIYPPLCLPTHPHTYPPTYSSPCLRWPPQPAAACHVPTLYSCTDHFSIRNTPMNGHLHDADVDSKFVAILVAFTCIERRVQSNLQINIFGNVYWKNQQ